jgi:GAF domain-containing protein
MEIQNDEGPCLDCHREGAPVLVADLTAARARWPSFADEAIRVGFRAVYALPMRLRADTVGALNLFHRDPDTITEATLRIGQALADVATIAILQQRAAQAREELSQQLQTALNSRVIIEQGNGVLAERLHIDMSTAFNLLRSHARGTHQQLAEVARAVVAGELGTDQLQEASPNRSSVLPT